MRKLLILLMVSGVFILASCGSAEEAKTVASDKIEEITNEVTEAEEEVDGTEKLAEHKCDSKCKTEGCSDAKCGGKEHSCSGSCHAKDSEDQEADDHDQEEEIKE